MIVVSLLTILIKILIIFDTVELKDNWEREREREREKERDSIIAHWKCERTDISNWIFNVIFTLIQAITNENKSNESV